MEIWERSISWAVTDGWLDRANGNFEDGAPIGRMEASCKACGHSWTLKKAAFIDDVISDE